MFKITARTVLELGSELISSDPIAFYELIKNGIDAGSKDGITVSFDIVLPRRDLEEAKAQVNRAISAVQDNSTKETWDINELKYWVKGKLITEAGTLWNRAEEFIEQCGDFDDVLSALDKIGELNCITVSDTGSGMSRDELSSLFLVIGTQSRRHKIDADLSDKATDTPYLGEKGIGRLSAMQLGDHLSVRTARESDRHFNHIDIDWAEFDDPSRLIEDIKIAPRRGQKKEKPGFSGTEIRIHRLNADWSEKRVERLAMDDLSLLVNPLGKTRQRVAVFWNGKRIALRRLERSFLSHANAVVRGSYKVAETGPALELRIELNNIDFEHPREISMETATADVLRGALVGPKAKRRRMNKRDTDYTALDNIGPFNFELYWFNRSILRKGNSTGDYQALHNLLDQWNGVRLYRDGFRVYPYGSEDDDWLELDKTALASKGYALSRIQLVGQVEIGRLSNPGLIDQTNREGLSQTPDEVILKETIQFAVERLRDEMNRITHEQKGARELFSANDTRTVNLEKRHKSTIHAIRKVVPSEHRDIVDELVVMREEFSRYVAQAHERIADMEKEADQRLVMAGIGLMVEVVAHELTRSVEGALDILNGIRRKTVPDEIRRRLEGLRASMNGIGNRLRILDPLSVASRHRKEQFKLDELVKKILEAHESQFERHKVKPKVLLPAKPVELSAVKGMVVQVLENLISNSIYWMDVEKQRNHLLAPEITIIVKDSPPRVKFSDNGPGISKQYRKRAFDLYFSLKDKSRRRGLGLFIAKEAAEHNGGSLTLDPDVMNTEGRYTTFDYQVVGDRS